MFSTPSSWVASSINVPASATSQYEPFIESPIIYSACRTIPANLYSQPIWTRLILAVIGALYSPSLQSLTEDSNRRMEYC